MKSQPQNSFSALYSSLSKRTICFVEGGVLLSLALVLSIFKLWPMPLGGEIDFCSMLPITLFAYKYGVKWGVLEGFAFAVLKSLLDAGALGGYGLTPAALVGSIFFDYVFAFSLLGIAGVYGKSFPRFIFGMVTAVLARFLSHVVSGALFYASSMPKDWIKTAPGIFSNLWGFSVAYNALYILPDLALCLIVGIAIYWPLKRAKLLEP